MSVRRDPKRGQVAAIVAVAVAAVCWVAVWIEMNRMGMAGTALAIAVVYKLTPIKRSCQARCREMCRRTEATIAFREAFAKGLRYGINCIGCSGALMFALFFVGVSNLAWMAICARSSSPTMCCR